MGGGSYSTVKSVSDSGGVSFARASASRTAMFSSGSRQETFSQRNINSAMSPYGVQVRESRDSEEHPNSVPIIIALDVTGSMGSIPHFLVKEGLPNIMGQIIQMGIPDPQVLFLAIGDHECDQAPLQVGQFESSDELLDTWLTTVWLEGRGGGNNGESYHLAWYFSAKHTEIDSFEKRGKKGFLFTIGDEPVLNNLPANAQKAIMGDGQYQDYTAAELFEMAREKFHVFHVHTTHTASGDRQAVVDDWKQLVQDGLLMAKRPEDVAGIIADAIIDVSVDQSGFDTLVVSEADATLPPVSTETAVNKETGMML